jgi:hypothetical protein
VENGGRHSSGRSPGALQTEMMIARSQTPMSSLALQNTQPLSVSCLKVISSVVSSPTSPESALPQRAGSDLLAIAAFSANADISKRHNILTPLFTLYRNPQRNV